MSATQLSTSNFDPETFIPPGETIVVHRISKLMSCSSQHIRNLIEEGEIKLPDEELARVKRKEKPWTMVSVPRASLVEFLRQRVSSRRRKVQRKGAAR